MTGSILISIDLLEKERSKYLKKVVKCADKIKQIDVQIGRLRECP